MNASGAAAAPAELSSRRASDPEILSIQVQQVECEEQSFPTPEQQIIEHRTTRAINASDLAIDDGILDAQVPADPLREIVHLEIDAMMLRSMR